jgi:glycosyltransferase involved in cell wall biosynthesis
MLEAMARGLPCIGSSVGGIPELLGPDEIVPPGDPVALARKIRDLLSDSSRMSRLSVQNLARAQEYREELLQVSRLRFYGELQSRTAAWLASVAAHGPLAAKATVD